MAKAKPSVAKLKKTADKYFSIYVRTRDSDRYGNAECISCGVKKPWKQQQAGHFVRRSVNALRYDDENVNAQCLTAESKLRRFNGTNASIADIKVGDTLWAFNEQTFDLEGAIVEKAESFVPKELYEVVLEDGSKFYATGDHRVVSNGKWVYIKDMLHNVSTHDILEL